MLYLEFIDWQDYLQYIAELGKVTHLDVIDASAAGQYIFYIVGTQPDQERGIIAVCSALILIAAEPEEPTDEERAKFTKKMEAQIANSRTEMREFFKKAGVRIRAGVFSIEPPTVLRIRK